MKRLIKFYYAHRKLCLVLVGLFAAVIIFNAPHIAHAAASGDTDPDTTKLLNQINTYFNVGIRFFSSLLWPVLLMIGSLLDNDLIFGGAMGDRLLGVWVQIRNLVNIVFVLILIAIAVYNVLGLGEEGGSLPFAFKTVIPKFVLALIAVNFSFLAVKVVLDFTNVVTGAVFALPAQAASQNYDVQQKFEEVVCGTQSTEIPLKPSYCDGSKLSDRAKSFFSRLDRSNISVVYAIRYAHAPQLKFIRDGIKGLGQLGFNIIFNAVLYAVYTLSFVALFLVLLFRLVAMWIAVVLSPLLALTIVLPNLKELAGGAGELQQKFVKSAIAPITIGLVLSVGYIMLDGFSVDKTLHGSLLAGNTLDAIDPNALPTDINDLQQLMIAIGVVVIVWTGVFGAAKDTVAGGVTEAISSTAMGFGKWVGKLPMYLQAIPVPGKYKGQLGKESVTPAELMATIRDIPGTLRTARGTSLLHPAPSEAQMKPWKNASLNSRPNDYSELIRALRETPQALNHPEGKKLLYETLVKTGDAKDVTEAETKFKGETPQEIATSLFNSTNPALSRAMKAEYQNIEGLKRAIESRGKPSAAPADPKEALSKKTLEELVKKGMDPAVSAAVVEVQIKDAKSKPFTDAQITAIKELTEDIKKLTPADITDPEKVKKALTKAPQLGKLVAEKVISSTPGIEDKVKTAALGALAAR